MKKELKDDLICSWNEVNEAIISLDEIPKRDLTEEVMLSIIGRLENAQERLGKYVSDKDVISFIKEN